MSKFKVRFVQPPAHLPNVVFHYAEKGRVVDTRRVAMQAKTLIGAKVEGYVYTVVGVNEDGQSGWVERSFKREWVVGPIELKSFESSAV